MGRNRPVKRLRKTPENRLPGRGRGFLSRLKFLTGRWRQIAVVLGVFLVLAACYPDAVFRGATFLSADSSNAEAFGQVGDAGLAAGGYPQWNPYLFAGMPSFASLAYTKFLYPPSVLLNFLMEKLGFPPLTWMLAHMVFGSLGLAWLLSHWRLPTAGLLLGAVIWLLCPKLVAWGVHGHGSKLVAVSYLPWIVGWGWRVLSGQGLRAIGMTGLLLGLQFLRGHFQISYYTLLVLGWLAIWQALWPLLAAGEPKPPRLLRWRRNGQLLVGIALGFMIGAVLLLPVRDYAKISIRGQDTEGGGGVGFEYATGWSLAPQELPTLILPAAAGFGRATYLGRMPFTDYPNYLGLFSILLAVASWWRGQRSLVLCLGIAGVLAVLVALGRFGPGFYQLLYEQLPYFNKFRIPSMILILATFVLAVLAPLGVDAWTRDRFPGGRPWLLPAALVAAGAVLLLGGGVGLAEAPYRSWLQNLAAGTQRPAAPVVLDAAWALHRASLIRIGLVLLAAGSAFWFATRNVGFRQRGLIWVLVWLAAVDLLGVDRLVVYPERGLKDVVTDAAGRNVLGTAGRLSRRPVPLREVPAGPEVAVLARALGHDRVWPLGGMGASNVWMANGIRSLGGYHPAKLAAYEKIRGRILGQQPAGRLASWLAGSVLAIEGALQPREFDLLRAWGADLDPQPLQTGSVMLYRNRSALPRARLLSDWRLESTLPEKDDLDSFLDGIQAGQIDVASTVILDRPPVPLPGSATEPLPEPVFLEDGLNEVVVQVRTPAAALLLLADMFAPGWQVEVDGKTAQLLRADLVLRAVALDKGEHTVRFHYRDLALRRSLWISLVGLLAALTLVAGSRFRRQRPISERASAHE